MSATPRPHDLVWLNHASATEDIAEPWVAQQWRAALPVVVRRDVDDGPRPVGVGHEARAARRRLVQARNIVRSVTPEMLVDREVLLHSPFVSQPPVRGYRPHLTPLAPGWGVTGSTGYALATEIPVLHAASDLDLLIRAPQPLDREALLEWQTRVAQLPCRADTRRNAVRRLRP
ncbi:malonate decarboxylase holo-ACP synthase [Klebsiella pneumoniae]|uniref:Malonate decarboxylase holo-ACP synthase n=1 Tax=Klebsiella pneumoniae TaxID=573 RepID=A0A939SVK5_KLEPN|nr:malonate decarboxylase holo-ACP synthase [Klebsiella pneumoniae]